MRTFVAIKIRPGQKLLKQIDCLKEKFSGDRINWVSENNLHLTLRFIGNTSREQLCSLVDAFEEFCVDSGRFTIYLNGSGYFKSKGNPRVLFIKVAESEQLNNLANGIEKQVVSCGFDSEPKPFRAHVTIGRIKHLEDRNLFMSVLDKMAEIRYQEVDVFELVLYQSILSPEGPRYKPVKTFGFK